MAKALPAKTAFLIIAVLILFNILGGILFDRPADVLIRGIVSESFGALLMWLAHIYFGKKGSEPEKPAS